MSLHVKMMNTTVQNTLSQNREEMILIAGCTMTLNLICSIMGSIGNLLVLLSYYNYQRMRTITNLHLCNLALVDLVVCVIIQPLYIAALAKNLADSEPNIHFETVRKILTWCVMTVASGSLTTVMLDRFCRVSFPLKYPTIINKRRSYIIITFPWLVGVVAGIMLVSNANANVKVIIQVYAIFLITGLIIPGYLRVFYVARKQSKKMAYRMKYLERISQQQMTITHSKVSEAKTYKTTDYEAIKTIFIVIAAFIICWTPLLFFPIYYRWVPLKTRARLIFIFPIINTLALCSSSLNPFIYCLRTPPFKHSFQKIIVKFYKNILTCAGNSN
jgi:hypothetical protein